MKFYHPCANTLIIRRFEPTDAAQVSALIGYTMRMSNSSDYSLDRLQPLIDYFTS